MNVSAVSSAGVSVIPLVTVAPPVVHPTWVDKRNGYVIRDVLAQLARTDLSSGQRSTYEKSLQRTTKMVGDFISPTP